MVVKTNFFTVLGVTVTAALAASLLILTVAARPVQAAFPGENGKIAFACGAIDYDGFAQDVCTMNPDGSGQANLTSNSTDDYDPVYASDGEKIAFVSERDGNAEIYVMNNDGSGQTRLTNDAAADSQPTFSPDGTKIAFTSDRDGNNELYVVNADDTGAPNRLTNDQAADVDPAFSPDGSKMAFTSDRDGDREIYVMNADGTGTPTRLTDNPASDRAPTYAPDSSKVAFMSDRDDFPGDTATNNEIYVTNSDGAGMPSRLTNDTQDSQLDDSDPTFSPDGTKIAFSSNYICTGYCGAIVWGPTISVLNAADGSGRTGLSNTEFGYSPDWGTQIPGPPPETTPPDTTPPETTIATGPSGPTNDNTPTFSFGGSDGVSANLLYSYSVDNGGWSAYSAQTSTTLASLSDGPHTFYVKAKDEAGNEDQSPAQRSFTVDTAAPTGRVIINNNATRTKTRTVALTLNATDPSPGSGVTSMRISNSQTGLSTAAWEPYVTSKTWTLSINEGVKTVYVEYRDAAGNTAIAQDTITYRR